MKANRYYWNRARKEHKEVKIKWIERVLAAPEFREAQPDGRVQHWGRIEERKGMYLLVITLADGVTVHNAFFDHRTPGIERPLNP